MQTEVVGPPVPGTLYLASAYRFLGHLGPFDYYRCVCCSSEYLAVREDSDTSTYPYSAVSVLKPQYQLQLQPLADIRCNGHRITLCPWCRADSKPWTAGRGA